MTEDAMWKAVSENDPSFDGIFFYAVTSTGIYCRPSCKSRRPTRGNVRFFQTADEAAAAGFRPCKRCRSDLAVYEPDRDIAEKAKRLLEASFRERWEHNRELRGLGISQRRLAEIFKEKYGVTPSEYVAFLRMEEAKRMLAETDEEIADIAFSAGFGSLSSFYRFFRDRAGLSPAAYRKDHRK